MATHSTFKSAFAALNRKIKSVQQSLPNEIAKAGTNYWLESFDKEAWNGKRWKTPDRKIPGTKSFKYPKHKDLGRRTRKTLIKSGRLKRDVNNSVAERNMRRVVWLVRNPYAARHNYGEDMPQRRFIGDSKTLRSIFRKKIIQAYKYAFK